MVPPRHLLVASLFVCIYLTLAFSIARADTGIYFLTQATSDSLVKGAASGLQIYQKQTFNKINALYR